MTRFSSARDLRPRSFSSIAWLLCFTCDRGTGVRTIEGTSPQAHRRSRRRGLALCPDRRSSRRATPGAGPVAEAARRVDRDDAVGYRSARARWSSTADRHPVTDSRGARLSARGGAEAAPRLRASPARPTRPKRPPRGASARPDRLSHCQCAFTFRSTFRARLKTHRACRARSGDGVLRFVRASTPFRRRRGGRTNVRAAPGFRLARRGAPLARFPPRSRRAGRRSALHSPR